MKSLAILISSFVLLCLWNNITCPPVTERPSAASPDEQKKIDEETEATNLEYDRYLREIVSVLESDQAFKKKLEESNISDIKSGEIAKHLDFVSHGIRTQLDEIKRREIERLRQVMRLKAHLQNGDNDIRRGNDDNDEQDDDNENGMKRKDPNAVLSPIDRDRLMGHLDHNNPESFEVDDLAKLIKKATSDLEEVDRKRRDEFKKYEMEKEHLRRKELEKLDAHQREEEEKKFKEQEKKHADHPKLHHPGNEAQLKEVWEDSDGLNEKDFDPRTFFSLHDTNGDGFLDEAEVEALFQNELDKMYDPNAPEDDMMERYEEMNRMREHVMNEVDKNKDKLVSLEEFIENTRSQEFKKDEAWETLDQEQVYSDDDFAEFEKVYEMRQKQKAAQGGSEGGQDHLGGQQQQHLDAGGVNVINQHQQQQQQHEQQAIESQEFAQPVYEQPAFEQPAVAQSAFEQPIVAQPAFEQPIVAQPAFEQPAFEQPAFEQPNIAQPAFEQPAFEQPNIAQPAFEQPAFEQPNIAQPAFEQQAFEQPYIAQPAFVQPAFEQPIVEQPAFEQPAFEQPAVAHQQIVPE